MSFIGGRWDEPTLIGLAYAFEQATQVRVPPTFIPSIGPNAAAGARGSASPAERRAVVPNRAGSLEDAAAALARAVGGRRNIEPEMVGEGPANGAAEARIGHDLRHAADLERRDPMQVDRSDLVDEHQAVRVWPACPAAIGTSPGYFGGRVVMGHTAAIPDRWNGSYDTTSARR